MPPAEEKLFSGRELRRSLAVMDVDVDVDVWISEIMPFSSDVPTGVASRAIIPVF